MLDFRRMKIEGDIESNVKNKLLQKSIFINFQAQKYYLSQMKITLQKLLPQRPTIYQMNWNSIEISIDFSGLRYYLPFLDEKICF